MCKCPSRRRQNRYLYITCRVNVTGYLKREGRSGVLTFVMDAESEFLRFITDKSRVSDWNVIQRPLGGPRGRGGGHVQM